MQSGEFHQCKVVIDPRLPRDVIILRNDAAIKRECSDYIRVHGCITVPFDEYRRIYHKHTIMIKDVGYAPQIVSEGTGRGDCVADHDAGDAGQAEQPGDAVG